MDNIDGETVTMINVLHLPPNESCNIRVNLGSRYGMRTLLRLDVELEDCYVIASLQKVCCETSGKLFLIFKNSFILCCGVSKKYRSLVSLSFWPEWPFFIILTIFWSQNRP